MIKSRRIDSFFKRNACDEDEKNVSTSSKLEKLHDNPKNEVNKKQLSKVPRVTYNEFENALECVIRENVPKFDNTHQIKLMKYEGFI